MIPMNPVEKEKQQLFNANKQKICELLKKHKILIKKI
jgi:hypothetical protein